MIGGYRDDWGNVVLEADGLVDHLMRGGQLSRELCGGGAEVERYNALCQELDHPEDQVSSYQAPQESVEEWDARRQAQWFTPESHRNMDLLSWLADRCDNDDQLARVAEEWVMFEERGMVPMLCHLLYLVENFRSRGILWGVGRGSSVASYCLFLMDVHRVDSMLYDLDINEFLK